MKTEIIIVGDEVLSGLVIDTNSAVLARALADIGLIPGRIIKVGDDKRAIGEGLKQALADAELVLVAGGMGPTPDDKTLEAVADALGRRLILHRPTLLRIQNGFQNRGMRMPALAQRQALVLERARLFANPVGMVPGMAIPHKGRMVVLLPGVPAELEAIMTAGVLPYLQKRFGSRRLHSVKLRTFGIPESEIAEKAGRLFRQYPSVTPAFYPSTTGVDVVIRGGALKTVRSCTRRLAQLLGDVVYEVGEREIAEVVGAELRRRALTIATAESCTGGLVGDMLTNVPGSSDYYRGGVVAYSNEMKMQLLGVKPQTLKRHGAVSSQTVREMARGVCRLMGADIGIAVSGIAGPAGGTRTKPVGLVFIAVAQAGKVRVERHLFSGNRRMVKERSAMAALDLCRRALEQGR